MALVLTVFMLLNQGHQRREVQVNDSNHIEEWIREVEERPSSAVVMMRFIANRLRSLTSRNEELLAENIALRSERKVEEYETRIANLEYQLEMLTRQLGGETNFAAAAKVVETISLIAYLPQGNILRFEYPIGELANGQVIGCLPDIDPSPWTAPRLVVTSPLEEMLFLFDSGRTIRMPVSSLPAVEGETADWNRGYLAEPRGNEELVCALPIGKMSLYDFSIQTSRRGCARKMMKTSFESHIVKGFVGTGVKQKPDRAGGLLLSGKDDLLVMASWEGFLTCTTVSELSFSAEEMLRLSTTDHIVSSFVVSGKPSIVTITQNGKAVVRDADWLEPSTTGKSRGQQIFSQSRRDAGVRVAGAAAVDANDWGAALLSDGRVTAFPMGAVLASGALPGDYSDNPVIDFTVVGVSVQSADQEG